MTSGKQHSKRFSLARLLWAVVILLLLAGTAYSGYDLFKTLAEKGEKSLEQGKRAIIEIASGKITVAESSEEKQKAQQAAEDAKLKAEQATLKAAEDAKKLKEQEALLAKQKAEEAAKKALNENTSVTLPALTPNMYKGKISVLITGLGINQSWTNTALNLANKVQLSISPYTQAIATLSATSGKHGSPLILDLPTVTTDYPYSDPGPYALLTDASDDQNLVRLQTIFNLSPDVKAIVLSPNESITSNDVTFVPILDFIARQKKWLIYQEFEKNRYVAEQAKALGIPYISHYILLDDDISEEGMLERMLAMYNRINRNDGDMVVLLRPYPASISMITRLLNDMEKAGYSTSPIESQLIK